MNVEQISAQEIKAIIKEVGGLVSVLRNGENEFGEPVESPFGIIIAGYFYKQDKYMGIKIDTAGSTVKAAGEAAYRLLTGVDDDTLQIQSGDYFEYNGIQYKITDLGKFENAYFNMSLEVM
ncbi:MAG: hypothetical protein GT589_03785 [Peptoclostridium sp.]|uniref:hypothetical protein n=1 Tax=Peptoclostridium sp. TaxID=1904860 RepID=UPI00139E2A8F|nr:hypothetical protein [Peptoclostridium sp.]MZQ75262.1 hypothetical protein [Peptoclostridium sp.]